MRAIIVDGLPGVARVAANRSDLWHRLAQALDRHFADRSKRAVPTVTLRRSRYDIERCRRLMHKNALAPIGAGLANMSHGGVTRARPR